ncbi:MAG: LON peptidase substrate-binding domain-containing protein [Sphingomonadales bacterium]|jgi:Lon protease-like protein|nr:LON peptidase substrate-binding domain-containing protein [Sphingomonadales bacterium]MBK9005070.1 LON peptidase substrate-binding domain-containing protein [Sphingomonadales bacterium]MBK9267196.1 LON peptidase substrate-binding domain-containing protein [Sphingomonadales bacterium]MBP6435188.1 LON peptidase substrate-binding domain-containing protein [Sphingorhabdus sp.]
MTAKRISIFPLSGAILLPDMQLPLHIFEPRYRALVGDALARDRMIGMIQPKGGGDGPDLFSVGCLGRIGDVEALEDGRYNIVLEGLQRFTLLRELDVTTPFRQIEGELWEEDEIGETLSLGERAALEMESRRFADAQGYAVDWNAVGQLDDFSLVNVIAQIAPFDGAAKQALLESRGLAARSELIIQLMQFFGRHDGSDDRVTLQ